MIYETILPVWNALRDRFQDKVKGLTDEDLKLKIGDKTLGSILHHTGEAEYIFADWIFGKKVASLPKPSLEKIDDIVEFLEGSNEFLKQAMEQLPEEKWHVAVETPKGESTPLEAVGRLMYHAGIHSGQITAVKNMIN